MDVVRKIGKEPTTTRLPPDVPATPIVISRPDGCLRRLPSKATLSHQGTPLGCQTHPPTTATSFSNWTLKKAPRTVKNFIACIGVRALQQHRLPPR